MLKSRRPLPTIPVSSHETWQEPLRRSSTVPTAAPGSAPHSGGLSRAPQPV